MNKILILIFEFFKTGLFAVGGGLATIPFLNEMSIKYNWFSTETLSTMIAISESTPGPMGINMATYVGYQVSGVIGGIITSLSLVLPSIIIVCIIANMFDKFKNSKLINGIFLGLRPSVIGFIISACLGIFISTLFNVDLFQETKQLTTLFNLKTIIILSILLLINKKHKLNPILTIVFCAFLGIVLNL